MRLEQQVVSLKLAKKLKELGVRQESIWFHQGVSNNARPEPENWYYSWRIVTSRHNNSYENARTRYYAAFTTSELGEMLPWDIVIARNIDKQWHITFQANGMTEKEVHAITSQDNEADGRAKLLIYLIENGHVNAQDL